MITPNGTVRTTRPYGLLNDIFFATQQRGRKDGE